MPKLIDQVGTKGVIIQATYPGVTLTNAVVSVKYLPDTSNNVKLRGVLYVYTPVVNSEQNDYFVTDEIPLRQNRTALFLTLRLTQNSIVRLVPLYDGFTWQVWANNTGWPPAQGV